MYHMWVAWLAGSFEAGGKEVEEYSCGRLLRSAWLITSAFYVNDQTSPSFKTGREVGIRGFKRMERFEKPLLRVGVEQRNVRGCLVIVEVPTQVTVVNLLWYSVPHLVTSSSSTQLTWCRLRESKCLVSSRLGVYLAGYDERQMGNGLSPVFYYFFLNANCGFCCPLKEEDEKKQKG